MTPADPSLFAGEATLSDRRLRSTVLPCLQLLWLVLLASPFANAEPIELRDGKGTGYRPAFEYLVDESGKATLAEIEQLPGDAFRTSGRRGIALGFIKGAVWLRFEVLNRSVSDTTWLLQVTDPLLDDIQVYQEIAGGRWRVTVSATTIRWHRRRWMRSRR